jgi:hypothetical protein
MTITDPYIPKFHSDNVVAIIVVFRHNALNGVLFSRFEASSRLYDRKYWSRYDAQSPTLYI